VGLYPVNESAAKKILCYKFVHLKGKLKTIEYLNKGKLAMADEGFARKVYLYSDNTILISAEDQHGIRMLQEGSYTYEKARLNANGVYEEITFLDRNFHEMENGGVSLVKITSDHKGRRKKSLYYDGNNRPVEDDEGVYGVHRKFDDRDQIIEVSFLNKSSRPIANKDSVSFMTYAYDEEGNETEINYLDLKKKKINAIDGMATVRYTYDGYGNKTETTFYDRFGNLTNATQGIAVNTFKYDESGNLINREYLDASRKPVSFNGFSKINFFYNKEGLCTRQVFFKKWLRLTVCILTI
jgi:YD repeat-containing protein